MSPILLGTAIAITVLQVPTAAPQVLDASAERDAYAIYASLLPPLWERASAKGVMPLQQETEGPASHSCGQFLSGLTGEWAEVATSFQRKNARVWLLQPAMPIALPYRLVPREEILADDARLVAKHGRGWQRLPGSLEVRGGLGRWVQRHTNKGARLPAPPHVRRLRSDGAQRRKVG